MTTISNEPINDKTQLVQYLIGLLPSSDKKYWGSADEKEVKQNNW